jgi:hypothetical protein
MVIVLSPWPAAWVMLAILSSTTVLRIAGMPALPSAARNGLQINRHAWLALPAV